MLTFHKIDIQAQYVNDTTATYMITAKWPCFIYFYV